MNPPNATNPSEREARPLRAGDEPVTRRPVRNPAEIGVLWRTNQCDNRGRILWEGLLEGRYVVGFTFTTRADREGMTIQVSRRRGVAGAVESPSGPLR